MTLGLRIFLGYLAIVALGGWFLLQVFAQELKPGVRRSTEDTLNDIANLLAELVRDELQAGTLANGRFRRAADAYLQRRLDARIGGFAKEMATIRIYVTNAHGIVAFDSHRREIGADYSRWNDVARTLQGKYGARSTRIDPNDELSSVMHVAAAVKDGERIIGVVTVSKPNRSFQPFIDAGRSRLIKAGAVLTLLSLAIGLGVSLWLSRGVGRIVRYAGELSRGQRAEVPAALGELAQLARAVAHLRAQIDGKAYVSDYVHALTHELKSPLSAIAGSAELLQEDLPAADRARFARHVAEQTARLHQLIERMLLLAKLEQLRGMEAPAVVPLDALVAEQLASRQTQLAAAGLQVKANVSNGLCVRGDRLLLGQALGNLLDNAVAFAQPDSEIDVSAAPEQATLTLRIVNRGPAIPEFALPRLFERFYSLPPPGQAHKGTGLGLPLVREIAVLHGGAVTVGNVEGGVEARLTLPVA